MCVVPRLLSLSEVTDHFLSDVLFSTSRIFVRDADTSWFIPRTKHGYAVSQHWPTGPVPSTGRYSAQNTSFCPRLNVGSMTTPVCR